MPKLTFFEVCLRRISNFCSRKDFAILLLSNVSQQKLTLIKSVDDCHQFQGNVTHILGILHQGIDKVDHWINF